MRQPIRPWTRSTKERGGPWLTSYYQQKGEIHWALRKMERGRGEGGEIFFGGSREWSL